MLLFQELLALVYLGLEADLTQVLFQPGQAQEPVRAVWVQAVAWVWEPVRAEVQVGVQVAQGE